MDATHVIQRDHREVERLFKELERANKAEDRARAGALARGLVRELSVHAAIEEQFLYPALRSAGADARVLDALEEHHAVKLTLAELDALPPASPRFAAKIRLLAENVRRHVAEEEKDLLPLLERSMDERERRALGEALERARRAAPTRPHPAAPDTPPGNFIAGAVASVWDRSRDALRGGADVLRTLGLQGASRSVDGARGLAARVRRRGDEAVDGALARTREAARDVGDAAREVSARVEVRASEAANEVGRQGRRVARAGRKGARAAGREYRSGSRGR